MKIVEPQPPSSLQLLSLDQQSSRESDQRDIIASNPSFQSEERIATLTLSSAVFEAPTSSRIPDVANVSSSASPTGASVITTTGECCICTPVSRNHCKLPRCTRERDALAVQKVLRKAPYQKYLQQMGARLRYAMFKVRNGWETKTFKAVEQNWKAKAKASKSRKSRRYPQSQKDLFLSSAPKPCVVSGTQNIADKGLSVVNKHAGTADVGTAPHVLDTVNTITTQQEETSSDKSHQAASETLPQLCDSSQDQTNIMRGNIEDADSEAVSVSALNSTSLEDTSPTSPPMPTVSHHHALFFPFANCIYTSAPMLSIYPCSQATGMPHHPAFYVPPLPYAYTIPSSANIPSISSNITLPTGSQAINGCNQTCATPQLTPLSTGWCALAIRSTGQPFNAIQSKHAGDT